MIQRKQKIVLYFPRQANPRFGEVSSKDLLPLSLLTIAGWPDRDGYEVVVIDANLMEQAEAHRRTAEACEGALLYGTTAILGYQVTDALLCSRAVKAAHPELPLFIGGWFASTLPELELATGLYEAVCLGQGEITFRELVQAVDSGASLDGVPGLALLRDGEVVRTAPRPAVGWDKLLNCPWHLVDETPYRELQLTGRVDHEVPRFPAPPGFNEKPYFGISYYGSFGCPEPCTFCCSPGFSGMRWKCMPGDRMADDLCGLQDRWGFDAVRFVDANWGVMEKRTRAFCEAMEGRDQSFWWFAFMQASSLVRYQESTLDGMRDAGLYDVMIGGETGDADMMRVLGKHSAASDNFDAAVALADRDICSMLFYIIGYPGETAEQMLQTVDECRRIAAATPLARPMLWPYHPIPGTALWEPSISLGYEPPQTLEEWGDFREYHVGEAEIWPGQIPPAAIRARNLFEHYCTLSLGLARGRVGWWERRARRRIERGDFRLAHLEARAFTLYDRLMRAVNPEGERRKRRLACGAQTSVHANRAPA